MQLQKTIVEWLRGLPCGWIRANVHSSLLFTLGLLIIGLLFISNLQPGLAEFRSLALTLPAIWVISLAVRIAAQHLVIGEDSMDLQTRIGPTGNLSTDYEFLRPIQILKYSIAGHFATLFLVVLGLVVIAAVLPANLAESQSGDSAVRWAELLDIHGGWGSLAWASQIMWVNILIGALNLLPTIPFDNRGLLYSLALLGRRRDELSALRSLANFTSHTAAFLIGSGLSLLGVSILFNLDSMGWYAIAAAGVYLFVASRWEKSRAEQLEQQCVSLAGAPREKHHKHHMSRHYRSHPVDDSMAEEAQTQQSSNDSFAGDSSVVVQERRMHVSDAYLDEILRKLHREGTNSLSIKEQEALLTASQKLKEKHRIK